MPVLAQLSQQVKWEPLVLSDINLSSFPAWAEKSETSELVAVLSLVNLGIHRGCRESPSVQVLAIVAGACLTSAPRANCGSLLLASRTAWAARTTRHA